MQQSAVVLKPNPKDGSFTATVPGHPDVVGRGASEEAALENTRMLLESIPQAGNGGPTSGAEDPDGALNPFKSRLDLEALASEYGVEFADANDPTS